MANNDRIFYPTQQVGLKGDGAGTYSPIHGVQSVSVSTTFNLEEVFQLSQLAIYENIEEIPDVEITMTKVLDGYSPMGLLATSGSANPLLQTRAAESCLHALSLFDDTVSSTSGASVRTVAESSGLFISSWSFSFPLDGNFTEDISFVGNDRIWQGDAKILSPTGLDRAAGLSFPGAFDGTDSPQGSSGVNRRQDLLLTSTGGFDSNGYAYDVASTVLPLDVFGIDAAGLNDLTNASRARLSNISVSTDLNRESINELGRKAPYSRTATFPVQVTTDIEVTSTSGDYISATEDGILTVDQECDADLGNTADRTIRVATCEGLRLYMGDKNRLASVNYGGGDAGGGNVTVSYSFTTSNHMTVMHGDDPNAAVAAFDITGEAGSAYLRDGGSI